MSICNAMLCCVFVLDGLLCYATLKYAQHRCDLMDQAVLCSATVNYTVLCHIMICYGTMWNACFAIFGMQCHAILRHGLALVSNGMLDHAVLCQAILSSDIAMFILPYLITHNERLRIAIVCFPNFPLLPVLFSIHPCTDKGCQAPI